MCEECVIGYIQALSNLVLKRFRINVVSGLIARAKTETKNVAVLSHKINVSE